MDGQARKSRLALTLGFGLLSTAILMSVGNIVAATAGVNDRPREVVNDFTTGPNTDQTDAALSRESLFDKLFGQQKDGAVAFIKSVSIRSQFYSELRSLPDWQSALWKIFRARIREELAVYQGFRTALRGLRDAPHRHSPRAWPM